MDAETPNNLTQPMRSCGYIPNLSVGTKFCLSQDTSIRRWFKISKYQLICEIRKRARSWACTAINATALGHCLEQNSVILWSYWRTKFLNILCKYMRRHVGGLRHVLQYGCLHLSEKHGANLKFSWNNT